MNALSPIPDDPQAGAASSGLPAPKATASAEEADGPGDRPPRPWGFWSTMGWTALWLAVSVGTGMALLVAMMAIALVAGMAENVSDAAVELSKHGLVLGVVSIVQMPVLVGLTFLLAWIRMPVAEYLGLRPLTLRQTAWGLVALFALLVGQDLATWGLGRPIVSDFMVTAYLTAGFLPVLVVALLVAAPVVEELFFRGFMFKGLAASKVGVLGAILITALLWSVIHLQYDWYGKGLIFVAGLFLGIVRWRTGSTLLPILLHAMMNAVATTQTIVVAEGWA